MKSIILYLLLICPLAAAKKVSTNFYGEAHVSVDNINDGQKTNVAISSNSSKVGVKGDYLGESPVKIAYQLEWHVSFVDENKNLTRRNTFVTLDHFYGKLTIGKFDTPMKRVSRKVDLFYGAQLGENATFTDNWNKRFDNGVQYQLGNVTQLKLAYFTDQNTSTVDAVDNNDSSALSASLAYQKDNIYIGLSYEHQNGKADGLKNAEAIRLGISYQWRKINLIGLAHSAKRESGITNKNQDYYGLGFNFQNDRLIYKATYFQAKAYDNLTKSGGNHLALGIDCIHDKNLLFYLTHSYVSNEANASYTSIAGGHDGRINTTTGRDNHGTSIGLILKI
jgi:hypothetical protein